MPRTTTIPLILRGEADASRAVRWAAVNDEPDWASEGLLDGLDGKDRDARIAILRDLHSDGVTLTELRKAVEENRLMFLPVERSLREEPRYSAREVAERSGVDLDVLTQQWQALGLVVSDPDNIAYGERDLEAAQRIKLFLDAGVSREGVIDMARVLGQSLSRVADASRFLIGQSFLGPESTEYDVAQQAQMARPLADLMESTLAYVYGLQLVDQLRHEVADRADIAAGQRDVTVCFADIVGWTELSEEAEEERIGSVADRLNTMATDLLRPPARVVKMIGDAAMFVSPEPEPLLGLALDLVDAAEDDEEFPQLRAGLASGLAVGRWGDWYGRPVNLASRVCSRARPGSVLVTEPIADACGGDGYRFSAAGQKRLKGIGAVPLWRVREARPDD
jgi:adenylate cyclase